MKKKGTGFLLLIILVFAMGIVSHAASPVNLLATSASATVLDQNTVQYTANLSSVPSSDDGKLYLYELKAYQDTIPDGAAPIASTDLSANPTMQTELFFRQENTRLYSKFALAVKQGGVVTMIAYPQYITNPEAIATNTRPREERPVKTRQIDSMTNVNMIGGPGADCSGFMQTLQIINPGISPVITHPYARGAIGDAHPITQKVSGKYYMLNAADDAGIAALAAELSYYAANSRGQDFVIGNEMNERIWNYMAWVDWDTYVKEYEQVFRVAYNAIKSTNANARVYLSIDQNWDRDRPTSHSEYYTFIDGKDLLDKFNARVLAGGNIDWDVAIHPYTVPLTYAKFWDMSGTANGSYMANMINSNKMVSFQNMSLVSNYMCQAPLRNRSGAVRDIIINEIGLSATQGNNIQAAAIAASFAAFEANPYITQYMYLDNYGDNVDARLSGQALAVYNAMGTGEEAAYMDWAKSIIGISDWSQVIR